MRNLRNVPAICVVAAAALITLAALAAYYDSFLGTFAYDDELAIIENPTIRQLWPIAGVLSPPAHGETVTGRPLLNLSLAVNYAMSGLEEWSYHVTNLLIHIAAALLLFGILRGTFLTPPLRDRFGRAATPLAAASTLLWTVHPLQTESVTYIVQRAESLASLFYLLTIYCVLRGAGTVPFFAREEAASSSGARGEKGDRPRSLWYAAAVLSCLLGMATKEVMVTAPLVVLLYDRTFLAGSFAAALRRRWGLYVGLAATWGLLAYLVLSTGLIARQTELGAPDWWSYARSQPGVILHYLRLSLWPHGLCMSYQWPVADTLGKILPAALVVGTLVAATVAALATRRTCGFLGAWFFLILAPTSSVLPLNQLAHDHRMYLPLAAPAVLLVAGGYALCDKILPRAGKKGESPCCGDHAPHGARPQRWGQSLARWAAPVGLLAAIVVALTWATVARNLIYRTRLAIWQDILDVSPDNAVAHYNLGTTLESSGKVGEAIGHYREAVRLQPKFIRAQYNLGQALGSVGRVAEAIAQYRIALRIRPDHITARLNLGTLLTVTGQLDEAIEQFHEVLRRRPDHVEARNDLGLALSRAGRFDEAIEQYRQALELKPDYYQAHNSWANTLAKAGQIRVAIEHYEEALRLNPSFAEAHNNLGIALASIGRLQEAAAHYRQALRLKSEYAEAHYNLGNVLLSTGQSNKAIDHYREAVRLNGSFPQARYRLARTLAGAGKIPQAIEQYNLLLQQMPNSAAVHNELARLLATRETQQDDAPARAVRLAQRARELSGRETAECSDTLAAAYAAAGRFPDAIITAEEALKLAEATRQTTLATAIRARLELYRAGQPYHEPPRAAAEQK